VLKPVDAELIRSAARHPVVVTVEDGVRIGGFGSTVNDVLQRRADRVPRVLQLGTPDEYLPHGSAEVLHQELGLDPAGIAASVRKALLRDSD
jgi:1-deoxy-D-xylulose-5-phosphate synthase